MESDSSREVTDIKQIKSDGNYIGKCPWCQAPIILTNLDEKASVCICCESNVIWNI